MTFVLRWWWIILLGPVVAGSTAAWSAGTSEKLYRSTATVLVLNELNLDASERLINTYAELVKLHPVLTDTKSRLSLPQSEEELANQISVSTNFTSQIIHITVTDPSPTEAADIANTIATTFVQKTARELARPTPAAGTEVLRTSFLRIAEEARPASKPSQSNVLAKTVIAAGLGLLVSLSMVVLFDALGWRIEFEKMIWWIPSPRPLSLPEGAISRNLWPAPGLLRIWRSVRLPRHESRILNSESPDRETGPLVAATEADLREGRNDSELLTIVGKDGGRLRLNGEGGPEPKRFGSDWLGDFTNEEVISIYAEGLVDERGRLFLQDESQVKEILEKRGDWSKSRIRKELLEAVEKYRNVE